ncbi:hypothetical protein [Nitrosopumilus sp.]|uniref:hypothetical protein n=1 Tax=Nitrosopumilus sp. TaxID=2024843 RepID=UPI00292D1DF8|nr:hypothetical protein [Nitrosopumilus sp.]
MKKIQIYQTEIGTIELTFPQDDDIISEEDEIKSIPEEDKIIGDVPDDDKEIIPDDDKVIPEDNVIDIVSDNDIESNDNKIDYTNMIGFVTLLVVMVAAYAFFKKLKDEKIKMKSVKKTLKKTKTVKENTIQFEEKLHIDIKTVTDDLH